MRILSVKHKSTGNIRFTVKDEAKTVLILSDATGITIGFKSGLSNSLPLLLSKTLSVVSGKAVLTLSSPNWDVLTPTDYVADIQVLKSGGVVWQSETFVFRVEPAVYAS